MKSLSSSIIILSAAILLTGGSFLQHNDTKLFVQAVGCLLGIIGLGGWIIAFRIPSDK